MPLTLEEERELRQLELRAAKSRKPQPAPISTGSMLTQAFFNAPASAVQFGRDIVEPILSPIDTAKSVVNLGSSVLGKAGITDADPTLANQVGEYFANRYGGVDNAMRTFATDPVGMTSDVAGLLTGGGTLVSKVPRLSRVGKAVETTGRVVDPFNITAITSTMPSLLSNASAFKQMFTKKHENPESEYHGKFFSPLSDSAAIGAAILKLDEE